MDNCQNLTNLQIYFTGMTAAEVLIFIVHLPLLLGDYVPKENKHYQLLLLLIEVVIMLNSSRLKKAELPILQEKISTYLEHYKLLQSEVKKTKQKRKLIPKQHFLTHYPRLIGKSGLVSDNLHIRFEAFHQPFKMLLSTTKNFRNVSRSIGNFFTRRLANNIRRGIYRLPQPRKVEFKPRFRGPNEVNDDMMASKKEILISEFPEYSSSEMRFAKHASVLGTAYRLGEYLLLEVLSTSGTEKPVFGVVRDMIVIENELIFWCETSGAVFKRHYNAFQILEDEAFEIKIVKQSALHHFQPYRKKVAMKGKALMLPRQKSLARD